MVGVARRDAGGGDPGRIHAEGMTARVAVEEAREQVAALLGARPPRGRVHQRRHRGDRRGRAGARPSGARTSWCRPVEHSAVRVARRARRGEVDGRSASTRSAGSIPTSVLAAVRPDTALVHVQWGNHEVGTVQPVAEVVAACRERGVLVHVDAAPGRRARADRLRRRSAPTCCRSAPTSSAARPGIGALLVRRGCGFGPLLLGGDQERARAGRARERAGHRRLRRRVRGARRGRPRRRGGRSRAPHRRVAAPASPTLDGVARLRRPRSTGSPTSCASASTASSRRPCCSASTRPASPPTRAAPARRRRSSRRRCSRPWASTPTARCASPSAGPPPTPTSTPSSPPSRRSSSASARPGGGAARDRPRVSRR